MVSPYKTQLFVSPALTQVWYYGGMSRGIEFLPGENKETPLYKAGEVVRFVGDGPILVPPFKNQHYHIKETYINERGEQILVGQATEEESGPQVEMKASEVIREKLH